MSRPMRSLAGALAVASIMAVIATSANAAEADSALLLRLAQAFSDAGQRGDAARMAALLDDQVIFVNEEGESATKKDMVEGAGPPPAGTNVKMVVSDWACQVQGNVAVASFIDNQTVVSHGEQTMAKFRSVETWLKKDGQWRLIGSQTLAIQDDPPSVTLPTTMLQDYVGAYQSTAGNKLMFTVQNGELTASLNGGAASAQKAELGDVFFTPGHPRVRKIFQRDAAGRVIGFVARHEGHDTRYGRV